MKKVNNSIDFIEFPARDSNEIKVSNKFYSDVFGWKFKSWGDDYIDTKSSVLGCGFNGDSAHKPENALVVIYCEDLKSAEAKIIDSGGRITKDIFSFPGGKRFHFKDPSGNELAVWSDTDL